MNATDLWNQEVKTLANERGCSQQEAWRLQRIMSPSLYSAYVAECAERKGTVLANEEEARKKKTLGGVHGFEDSQASAEDLKMERDGMRERQVKVAKLVNELMAGGLDYDNAFRLVKGENPELFPVRLQS